MGAGCQVEASGGCQAGVCGGRAPAGRCWLGAGCLAGGCGAREVRLGRRCCRGWAPGKGRGVTRTSFARWVTPLGALGGRWVVYRARDGVLGGRWVLGGPLGGLL